MGDTSQLTELISALRAETGANSVSPERVGYVLQQIVDLLPRDDTSGQPNAVVMNAEPYLNTTGASVTVGGVTVPGRSLYIPASATANIFVAGNGAQFQSKAQVLSLEGYGTWCIVFDTSTGEFEAVRWYLMGNMSVGKYLWAVISPFSVRSVLHINSWRYNIDGTVYTRQMPESLPATVASQAAAIAGLQADVLASQHEAYLVPAGGGVVIDTKAPKTDPMPENPRPSDYKVTIAVSGTVYLNNGNYSGVTVNQTLEYSNSSLQYIIYDAAQGELKVHTAVGHTKLGANEYLLGIISLPVGYGLTDARGMLKLNCASYTINGEKYLNRCRADIEARVAALESAAPEAEAKAPNFANAPYPKDVKQLKILAIGNSFTADGTALLPRLLTAADASAASRLCVYQLCFGSARLSDYVARIEGGTLHDGTTVTGNETYTLTRSVGGVTPAGFVNGKTLPELLNNDWDIIVVQQASDVAADFSTYGSLPKLIRYLRQYCPNENVSLAWQLVWSHTAQEDANGRYEALTAATRQMVTRYGIDVVIPTGTAIQNARAAFAGTYDHYLTRDNWHLGGGLARYVAACTWWETLIAPWIGKSALGNAATVDDDNPTTVSSTPTDKIDVTDANRHLAQLCAVTAVAKMWEVSSDLTISEAHKALADNQQERAARQSIEQQTAANAAAIGAREWQLKAASYFRLGDFDQGRSELSNLTCKRWRINFLTADKTGGEVTIEAQVIADYLQDLIEFTQGDTGQWTDATHKEPLYFYSASDESGRRARVVVRAYLESEAAQTSAWVSHSVQYGSTGSGWQGVPYYKIYTQAI